MSNFKKLLSVAGLACLPGMAFADTPTLGSIFEASGVDVGGHISASYSANLNDGQSLNFRAYDSPTDNITIDQASVYVGYAPESGFGGFVQVIAGEDANVINANFADGDSIFSLPIAYASYANGGLTVIAGRFGSLAGYEVTPDPDAPFISRSFLFNNTQPFFHTGVRASYALSDMFTVQLGAVNSAPAALTVDNNEQKTIEANITFTPSDSILLSVTDYYGFDNFGASGETVGTNIFDIVGQWTPTESLTLAFNLDVFDIDTIGKTQGVAFYGMFQMSEMFALRGRVELAQAKPDGGPTTDFQIYTIAGVLSPASNFDLLAEVRLDNANDPVFLDGAGFKDSGGNVAVKGIFKF